MEMIKKRRKFGSGQVNGDFLDDILMKECLNDEERASVLLDLFLAGYETTSGLIALIVYSLKQAPLALQRLKVHLYARMHVLMRSICKERLFWIVKSTFCRFTLIESITKWITHQFFHIEIDRIGQM